MPKAHYDKPNYNPRGDAAYEADMERRADRLTEKILKHLMEDLKMLAQLNAIDPSLCDFCRVAHNDFVVYEVILRVKGGV